MDKRAKKDMQEILSDAKVEGDMIPNVIDSLVDVFNSYRRRMFESERKRREIEAEIRNEQKS